MPADFDSAKFGSMLIVTATHPEDKKFLWDNKDLMQKANVLAPWQLVDKVLLSGEKDRVIELIEYLSGADDEDEDLRRNLKKLIKAGGRGCLTSSYFSTARHPS